MESDSPVSETAIAGHTLSEQLGGGGFGTVWRARGPHGDVAIKILHAELIRSSDALGRFQREQEAIARVVHPNVVRSYGHGVLDDGRPYLILELLRGPTLEDEVLRRHGLPPGEVVQILATLGDALDQAHANNIIHRDVKAGNIILAQGPEGPRPVLLDFGLAKLLDQEGPGLTNSRHMVGTPSAMSPEQLRGTPVDARTDVYSVGLLAYHMLTGERPFAGVPAIAQGYLLLHGARPRPSEKVPMDPAIDAVVMRAMAIEPADRFASVGEMVAALAHAVAPHRDGGAVQQRALGAYLEITTKDAERRERCSSSLVEALRELGFVIAIEAPDSIIAASPDPTLRMAQEVVRQVKERCGEAEVRIALGMVKAMFDDGNVDGEWIDVESWAPYPLVDPVWIDPKLR
jgi:eukaryotic-like serine/threonine-protein kinase